MFCELSVATDLFEDDSVLQVTLTGPVKEVFRHKEDEKTLPFILEVDGKQHRIMVSTRGNSRKKACSFPPLKLQFETGLTEASIFFDQSALKLVTHCNKSKIAQDNLLEEYAAYRFFNLLSDASYRVRLLNINYIDTSGKNSTQKMGFIIEPNASLAARNDGRKVSLPAISLKQLNDRQTALVYVFQYLIGNTDWSLVAPGDEESCCHNGKLIQKNEELLYVPYDFDLAGLVDARYAFPDPSIGIKKVTRRRYRGFCIDRPVLASALKEVKSHEAMYSNIIDNAAQLSDSAKRKPIGFSSGSSKRPAMSRKC